MADDKSIIDQGAKAAQDWISKSENQKKAAGWLQTAWSWLSGCFKSKKK